MWIVYDVKEFCMHLSCLCTAFDLKSSLGFRKFPCSLQQHTDNRQQHKKRPLQLLVKLILHTLLVYALFIVILPCRTEKLQEKKRDERNFCHIVHSVDISHMLFNWIKIEQKIHANLNNFHYICYELGTSHCSLCVFARDSLFENWLIALSTNIIVRIYLFCMLKHCYLIINYHQEWHI